MDGEKFADAVMEMIPICREKLVPYVDSILDSCDSSDALNETATKIAMLVIFGGCFIYGINTLSPISKAAVQALAEIEADKIKDSSNNTSTEIN
jgi:hypothetical protein